MENVLMNVIGQTGQLELLENKLRIKRKVGGAITQLLGGLPREKVILLKDISTINYSPAVRWRKYYGFIQFVVKGAKAVSSEKIADVQKDENAVVFIWKDASDFQKIKDAIEDKLSSIQEGGTISTSSNLDELEKLASLHDKGIITDDEFEAKKKELLKL